MARDVSRVNRLEQVRRDFVANVSHELRTPLTVIHGYLELLDPVDVLALATVLAEMQAQSQRMRQIVDDLLALSRLEMQKSVTEERVEMEPLLHVLTKEGEALSRGRHWIAMENTADSDFTRVAEGPAQRILETGQQRGALHACRQMGRLAALPRCRRMFGSQGNARAHHSLKAARIQPVHLSWDMAERHLRSRDDTDDSAALSARLLEPIGRRSKTLH